MNRVDPGLDLQAVREYLLAQGVELVGDLRAELIAGGRSNLTFRLADDRSRWVLRRPPLAGLTPAAHDVAREHRVTGALDGTAVPVAKPVLLCTDETVIGAPFTVVAHVDGRTLRTQDDLSTLGDAELLRCSDELMRVLGALHRVGPDEVGLGALGRPGYVERQVALWRRQWELVSAGPSDDLERLHGLLVERIPAEQPLSVVHGDFRIDNTLVDPHDAGRVLAVVDWELATLGDARADLAMTCGYRHPAFDLVIGAPAASTSDRLPTADRMAQQYAVSVDDDLGDWPFYQAFAAFKMAVIFEGIRHRAAEGDGGGDTPSTVGQAVPEFVAHGLAALHARRITPREVS